MGRIEITFLGWLNESEFWGKIQRRIGIFLEGKEKKRKEDTHDWRMRKKEFRLSFFRRDQWMFQGDWRLLFWNRQRRLFVDSSEIDPAIGKVHRDRPHWILKEQQPQHSEDWGPHHPWRERARFWKWEQVQPYLGLEEYFGRTKEDPGERSKEDFLECERRQPHHWEIFPVQPHHWRCKEKPHPWGNF